MKNEVQDGCCEAPCDEKRVVDEGADRMPDFYQEAAKSWIEGRERPSAFAERMYRMGMDYKEREVIRLQQENVSLERELLHKGMILTSVRKSLVAVVKQKIALQKELDDLREGKARFEQKIDEAVNIAEARWNELRKSNDFHLNVNVRLANLVKEKQAEIDELKSKRDDADYLDGQIQEMDGLVEELATLIGFLKSSCRIEGIESVDLANNTASGSRITLHFGKDGVK